MSFDTLNQALLFTDGNGNKWFRGKVKTNVDPKNFDRIQVTIPGIYDSDLGPIPWAGPMKMSPFGFGSGYGVFGTPVVGSDVMVTMQGGDPHYPMYMHMQCFANPSEFPSGLAWGYKDPDGNALIVHGKDIQFKSGGGYIMHIDESGNFTVTTPAGTTGTWNVPHVVYNVTDFKINATTEVDISAPTTSITGDHFNVSASANIDNVTIDKATGNMFLPGSIIVTGGAVFDSFAAFDAGFSVTGTATSDGHDIGYLHKHFNASGSFTGIVST